MNMSCKGKRMLPVSNDMITFERKGFIVPQITYTDFHRMAESNLHLSEKYKRYHIQNSVDNRNRNKILLSDKMSSFSQEKSMVNPFSCTVSSQIFTFFRLMRLAT